MSTNPQDLSSIEVRRWPPASGFVIDRRGNHVDVTGDIWRLNDAIRPVTINWSLIQLGSCPALDALQAFIGHAIKTSSSSSVMRAHQSLRFLVETSAFQAAARSRSALPYLAFSQARQKLGKEGQWRLHDARAMYRWCAGQRFDGFSYDVLDRIEEWTLGGNPKGRAVRSRDPKQGPLSPSEVAAIIAQLNAARLSKRISIEEQAAIVLCLATGSNAGQYASLREEDLKPIIHLNKTVGYFIDIPRHKKGFEYYRAEFKTRKLDVAFGTIIEDLVWKNRIDSGSLSHPSRPLFRRKRAPRFERNDEVEWLYHADSSHFTKLVQSGIRRLGVTGRDGEPLAVTTRRLRYTLLTRMRNNGASTDAMVDAADHSDDQSVRIYEEISSDIVEHLDKALTFELAPRAQALAGIVSNEVEAIRGDQKGSRRYLADAETKRFEAVGTCGLGSHCNITAPYACYRCVKFQAWMDGPHEDVLDQMLRDRQRRAADALDRKMVAIDDEIIVEVANVIKRIQTIKAELSAAND